jgi:hypothetical protein
VAGDLTQRAVTLASTLLSDVVPRWLHVQAVGRRAAELATLVSPGRRAAMSRARPAIVATATQILAEWEES